MAADIPLDTAIPTSTVNDTNVTGAISGNVLTLGWTGTLAKVRLLSTTVFTDQANAYTAGAKQTFGASASTAGLRLLGVAADPSTPAAGDVWYRTDLTHIRLFDTAVRSLMTQSDSVLAAQMPALTGDIASSAGAVATTLATVNAGPGACGDATHVCAVTTNGKGLVTAQSAVVIATGGTGTVTATAGALTNNQLVFGAGGTDTKVGNLSGDAATSGTGAVTVTRMNGVSMAGLATGLVVNTTGTGAPSTVAAPTGAVVGTTDAQTLTNKSIAGSEINSGTIPVAQSWADTGDATRAAGSAATTVVRINGVSMAGLATGIVKNTTTTGVPSIAVAGTDYALPVASGTLALGTSAIASGTCATAVTAAAAGVATTDVIRAGFNGDPTAVTGYTPSTNGMLAIVIYPTAGNVNAKVCNTTLASITPGAITLNWRVAR